MICSNSYRNPFLFHHILFSLQFSYLLQLTISEERKTEYCSHLLDLAATLSPGQSELRGYLLWEQCGAQLHLQRLDTGHSSLLSLANSLREVVAIFGQIREDSLEGLSGRKVNQPCTLKSHPEPALRLKVLFSLICFFCCLSSFSLFES